MKKLLLIVLVAGLVGVSGFAYYTYRNRPAEPAVSTSAVSRGDIVDTVGATGTLQAVTTVQVGTQVSGTIQALYVDFNSLVKRGQILARLDPSLFQTQIEQARANLIRAQADLERLRVGLDDARAKLRRAEELSGKQLIPASELETTQVNVRTVEAQIRSSEAQVTQARASLNQNEVNLGHTVISAPIDGLVISRNVDVGQTVAASMQAPTLFVLAADLTKMQVVANLDESDVGRIRPNQRVTFRVDAFPAEDFAGAVTQVRLQPIVQQNVVTYATVIDVPNPELKLKPGMTANVNIEINRRVDVLRIPNAALRFRPTAEIFAALGQAPPDPAELRASIGVPRPGAQTAGSSGQAGVPGQPAAGTSAAAPRRNEASEGPASDDGTSEGSGPGGRRGRGGLADRMQSLSPEERARLLEQMRARGFEPGAFGRGRGENGNAGAQARAGSAQARSAQSTPAGQNPSATTIDGLFAPLPPVENAGRVWLFEGGQLRPLALRTGVSDGQNTELLAGDLQEGVELVTNVTTAGETRPTPTSGFPGLGPRGGFPGGGGGNRGGGGGQGR